MSRQTDFINSIGPHVKSACEGTPIFASVCLAQAILETGWGRAILGNNLFGIKATGSPNEYWHGAYKESYTYEYIGGVKTRVKSKFRDYEKIEDSVKDHNRLFLKSKRYTRVLFAKSYVEQAKAIQVCGYATDPGYANKLITLVKTYGLNKFDL